MINTPKQMPAPKVNRLSLRSWNKGYMSSHDDGRMPNNALVRMTNSMLSQNGTIVQRPGLRLYGEEAPGEIVGFAEYTLLTQSNRRQTRIIAMIKGEDGLGRIYTSLNAKNWQAANGDVTFDVSQKPSFLQANYKVIVTNGVDFTSFFDIKENTISRPSELSNVTEVTATQSGLAGSNITYHYVVTAIKSGETARSVAGTAQVSKPREEWRGNSVDTGKEFITVKWKKVPGAEKYVIYMGITKGSEEYMTVVNDNGESGNQYQTYVDSGKSVTNPNNIPPNSNSTRGVRAERAELIGGRIYLVGDTDDPYKLTAGGQSSENIFDFSAFSGFYIRINAGSKEFPVAIKPYRTGRGDAVPMILLSGSNGNGSLKYLQSATTEAGGTPITWMQVIDDTGRDGTDAPDTVVIYQNDLFYLNRSGITKTGTLPQIQNVLSNRSLTETIQPDIDLLNSNTIHKSIAEVLNGQIYFAVPVGSNQLNQIWVLDMVRGGAWTLPWVVGDLTDMCAYGDSDGSTRLLISQGNRLREFSKDQEHSDEDKPFVSDISSGILKFSEDGAEWANILSITFVLLRPKGKVQFSLTGKTEDSPSQTLLQFNKEFEIRQLISGWSDPSGWSSDLGWGLIGEEDADKIGEVRVSITKDVDEDVNWLQYTISGNTHGTRYEISDVIIEYVSLGTNFEEDED